MKKRGKNKKQCPQCGKMFTGHFSMVAYYTSMSMLAAHISHDHVKKCRCGVGSNHWLYLVNPECWCGQQFNDAGYMANHLHAVIKREGTLRNHYLTGSTIMALGRLHNPEKNTS